VFKHCITDLETDGLLDTVSTIHVFAVICADTEEVRVYGSQPHHRPIAEGLALLRQAELVIWHNGIKYDGPVLKKLHGFELPWQQQRDTMVLSRLIWADMARIDMDVRAKKKGKYTLPGYLTGAHSLEAWGHRLGEHKGDYKGDPLHVEEFVKAWGEELREQAVKDAYDQRWDSWNRAMEDYCIQDLQVTLKLWRLIVSKGYADQAMVLETQVASILSRQERYGFLFDEKAAASLYAKLVARKLEITSDVLKVFKPRYRKDGKTFTPKRDSKAHGYCAEAPITKVVLTDFNPDSRDHICEWLKAYYGWEPTEFTADGNPKVDDEVLSKLPYPEVAPLKEYLMLAKRIGQVAEGKQAWLKKVGKDGRMHGSVNPNGAVTGRMTHSHPNMGQVPASYSSYGHDCRALYIVPAGKLLVGCDADALELRDLAGYMAFYDGGAYIETVLKGDKKAGTDMHSVNARALGVDPTGFPFGDKESGRDIAKTWFYAFIYGAGDEKLGSILMRRKGDQARKKGKASKAAFFKALPALGKLVERVKKKAKEQGHLLGLDGRHLSVRSDHAALNTLLQAAGAAQMKRALCILDDDLQAAGLIPGQHYEFVANVHDEWQIEVDEDKAEMVGQMAAEAIRKAGVSFNFRCPLAGDYKVGRSWAETH
jgi:DNA polymerase-1